MTSINDRILTVLPLIYVGWSDSVLSPTEMKVIRSVISEMEFLDENDKKYLSSWTDPTNPPPEEVFKGWMKAIKEKSKTLGCKERNSLVELGLRMGSAGVASPKSSDATRRALERLEKELCIDNPMSAHLLLKKLNMEDSESDTGYSTSFSPDALKDVLDGDYKETKERMRQLLRDPVFELKHEADKDIYRLRILKMVKALADQGVSAYSFPKKYGGGERHGDHIAVFLSLIHI